MGQCCQIVVAAMDEEVNGVTARGATALHMASSRGHEEVVRTLVAVPGIALSLLNEAGKTPLDFASVAGSDRATGNSSVDSDSSWCQWYDFFINCFVRRHTAAFWPGLARELGVATRSSCSSLEPVSQGRLGCGGAVFDQARRGGAEVRNVSHSMMTYCEFRYSMRMPGSEH